jgi:hypothetical protein
MLLRLSFPNFDSWILYIPPGKVLFTQRRVYLYLARSLPPRAKSHPFFEIRFRLVRRHRYRLLFDNVTFIFKSLVYDFAYDNHFAAFLEST